MIIAPLLLTPRTPHCGVRGRPAAVWGQEFGGRGVRILGVFFWRLVWLTSPWGEQVAAQEHVPVADKDLSELAQLYPFHLPTLYSLGRSLQP